MLGYYLVVLLAIAVIVIAATSGSMGRIRKRRTGSAEALSEATTSARQPISFPWGRLKRLLPFAIGAVVAIAIIGELWSYHVELMHWFSSWMPPKNGTMPTIDTPAATPGWVLSGTDFASYAPIWWEQALIAAFAALIILVILIAASKKSRAAFWGWGVLWTIPLLAVLTVTLFFTGPYIVAWIREAPDWTARTWGWAAPIAWKVVLSAAVITLALACLIGIPKISTWGERFAALGATLLGAYFFWFAIWNHDESRHAYASAPGAAVAVLAPNTTPTCSGVLTRVTLDSLQKEINPNGCFLYWKVDVGRVILSGPFGQKEVGTEPSDFDARIFYKARAKTGNAEMRYLLCSGPKSTMGTVDCT